MVIANRLIKLVCCALMVLIVGGAFGTTQAHAARNCVPSDNLDETAGSFIARCKKGSVMTVFPREFVDSTLGDIFAGTTAPHRTAKKLIQRRIYNKFEQGPGIYPTSQFTTSLPTSWEVTVNEDPNYAEELEFDFGDGTSTTRAVPQGSGSVVFTITHSFSSGTLWDQASFIIGGSSDGVAFPDGEVTRVGTVRGC